MDDLQNKDIDIGTYPNQGIAGLWISMFISAIFPMTLGFVLAESFSDWRWSHYPFHSMVESVGSLSALTIATLMVIMLKNHHLSRRYIMVVCALVGMGMLDGFHAVLHVGVSFVWLHSIATMVGGILFASVWLPEAWLTETRQRLLLITTVIASLFAGIASITLSDILPIMVVDGQFSLMAKTINISGGIGFLIGTSFFVHDYWQKQKIKSSEMDRTEDMVFANHCLLFGIAGLLFEASVLWDAGWWWWHILRLLAYLVVLIYFFTLFKRGQDELSENEEQLRLINSRVPGILYQFKIDANGKRSLPYAGPTVENYIGLSAETVMEDVDKWFALTHPDDLPGLEASIAESMESMTLWEWEGRFISENGNLRWLHGSSMPARLEDGSVLWDGLFVDVTEQKKAEAGKEQSQARFEAIFESIPDAIVYADPDRNIRMVNSTAIKMFGYKESELAGNQTSMLYAFVDDYEQQGKKRFNIDSNATPAPYEVTYRSKDGKEFQGETLGVQVKSPNGEVLGYLGIIRDISEQKHVDAIFKSLAAGTSSLTFDSFMNDALERLVDLYDCKYAFVAELQPDGEHMKTLAVLANGKVSDNFEYSLKGTPCQDILDTKAKLVPKDASKIYAEDQLLVDMGIESYYGTPLISSTGSILGILSLMDTKEMTFDEWAEPVLSVFATRLSLELERNIAAIELLQHKDHLEKLVHERTYKMELARDEAERANLAKSEFLSRMSHELRTPMNAILGFGQVLEMNADGLDEIQRSNVREILDAGYHLLDLINEVLDLAKIESGKMEVSMEEVSVNDVLQQSITLVSSQLEARQLELIDHVSSKGYKVHADFTRLKQVMLNLLSNAVKYNRDYGQIRLDSEIIGNQRLRIRLTATGEGLTKDDLSKLFTSFERLNASKNIEGSGIGLIISKHLIELMGGSIGVESTPREGSVFWIELTLSSAT